MMLADLHQAVNIHLAFRYCFWAILYHTNILVKLVAPAKDFDLGLSVEQASSPLMAHDAIKAMYWACHSDMRQCRSLILLDNHSCIVQFTHTSADQDPPFPACPEHCRHRLVAASIKGYS